MTEKCLPLFFLPTNAILYLSRTQAGATMDIPNIHQRRKQTIKFSMPDIPREAWCDFRKDFVEKNMTLVQLAQKYCCDPRTVRNCIQHNKSSFELGKKSTPTHMQLYEQQVRELILHNIDRIPDNVSTVYSLSHHLYPLLQNHGYSGSERTLRNYLQTQPYIRAVLEKHVTGDTRIVKELTSSSEMEVL